MSRKIILHLILIATLLSFCNCEQNEKELTIHEQINVFQNKIEKLCVHIEHTSLDKAKKFVKLMRHATIECPEEISLKIQLENVFANAIKHNQFTEAKLTECKELSDMVLNGLSSGSLFGFYLSNGNYTLARNITYIWHQSFTRFSGLFFQIDVPLEILANNLNVFYAKRWNTKECFISWIIVLVSFFCLKFVKSLNISTNNHCQKAASNDKQMATLNNSWFKNVFKMIRKLALNANALILLTMLLIAILAKSHYLEFYPERKAMLWFPDGKDSIESMLTDRDHVHATLQNRIIAIENIQKIVSIFSDKNFQTSVEQFRNNIMKGHTMVVTEVQEYFNRVDEYGLALSSVLKSVESKAIRAGRLEETKPILEALKLLDDDINKLKKNVFTMKVSLSNYMPILIEQTKEFRHLLQNDRLEIRSVIGDHKNILTDLAKNEDKIKLSIAAVGTIIGERGMNGHTDELIDVLERDELTAKFKGIIGAVGAGGLVPFIWRGSMLLFSPLVAGPAFLGASAVVIGTGLLNFNQQLEKQKDSHNYQVELNKLNNVMSNLNIAIKQYEKALAGQKLAREKSQQALNDISAHLGEHLNIRNSFLPIQVKNALFYEIDKLLNNYNRMINFLEIQNLIQSSNKRIY